MRTAPFALEQCSMNAKLKECRKSQLTGPIAVFAQPPKDTDYIHPMQSCDGHSYRQPDFGMPRFLDIMCLRRVEGVKPHIGAKLENMVPEVAFVMAGAA